RDAGSDARDVRPVERARPPEREVTLPPGTGARERARHDHLLARPPAAALWEAHGVREPGRVEERVRLVDAVVDDPDLDPLAAAARGGPEGVGADHRRALVRVEVVARARVDLAH